MTARSGYVSGIRGFSLTNYYVGANGQMAGGDNITAAALFSAIDSSSGDQAIWGNLDGPAFAGWVIEVGGGGQPQLRARVGTGAALVTVGPVVVPTGWLLYSTLTVQAGLLNLYLNGARVAEQALGGAAVASTRAPMVGAKQSNAPTNPALSCLLHGVAYSTSALTTQDIATAFRRATSANDLASLGELSALDYTNRFSARFSAVQPGILITQPPAAPVWTPAAGPVSLTRVGDNLTTLGVTRMEWATPPPLST